MSKKSKNQGQGSYLVGSRYKDNTPSELLIKNSISRLTGNPFFDDDDETVRTELPRKKGAKAKKQKTVKTAKAPKKVEKTVEKTSEKPVATAHHGTGKLKVIPLGGIGEIGKNITLLEYGSDILIIDCGLGFPDEDMLGVDIVVPDISYLEANRDKVRGLVLTHGHEDHIGGVPYLLRSLNVPVYGTPLTLKIIENRLKEFTLPQEPNFRTVNAGDTIKLGSFSVEFIRVNHSIADACCLAIKTPVGMVIHSGDFKLDLTPIEGDVMNITRLGELGAAGVLLLMCESTNAERPGYTPSERTVGKSLEYIFTTNKSKRLIISTFSSNVHRVQQIIDASAKHKRKVVITGRSMINIIRSASELGYMNLPDGVLIDVGDMRNFKPNELTVICTGSQGEPMSALYRMTFGDKNQIDLDMNDMVVISASAIPGNEKLVGRIINELCRRGIGVMTDPSVGLHVSGHACQEELKLMQVLTKPKYFMPVHGEYRHLQANRELAHEVGIEDRNIFMPRLGQIVEIDRRSAKMLGTVPAGNVLVDGSGIGEVGEIVLRDRRLLAQDGLIVVVAAVDLEDKTIITKPDVISRGFVYMRQSEELIDEMRNFVADTMSHILSKKGNIDRIQFKTRIRDELSRFVYTKTRRKPMILPVIMDV